MTTDPANKPDPPREPVAPYDLAPEDASAPPPAPRVKPGAKARIDAPGLMDDLDEDADLERDPEVEARLKGKPAAAPEPPDQPADFVRPGRGSPKTVASMAVGVLLAAVVVAGVTAPKHQLWAALSAGYLTLLHTGTGVLALAIAAHLAERPMRNFALAAARMFLAVALFQTAFRLSLPIPSRSEEWLLGAALYLGTVAIFFRLPPAGFLIVAAVHGGLATLIFLASLLAGAASEP